LLAPPKGQVADVVVELPPLDDYDALLRADRGVADEVSGEVAA
jgi:hypothetical protein